MKLKHQRVAILVDGQNIYLSAKEYGRQLGCDCTPNFDVIMAQAQGRPVIRAIAYIVEVEGCDSQPFVAALEGKGFEVRAKQARKLFNGKFTKADWDMGIAMDAIALSNRTDVIILAGGDRDYIDLVSMLKSRGLRVEVEAFENAFSVDLMNIADEAVVLMPNNDTLIMKTPFEGRAPDYADSV
jgi:uncharacterized LabA/DUF88 family protein